MQNFEPKNWIIETRKLLNEMKAANRNHLLSVQLFENQIYLESPIIFKKFRKRIEALTRDLKVLSRKYELFEKDLENDKDIFLQKEILFLQVKLLEISTIASSIFESETELCEDISKETNLEDNGAEEDFLENFDDDDDYEQSPY